MEAFETWFNNFDCDTIDCHGIGCNVLCKEIREETWRAALGWVKTLPSSGTYKFREPMCFINEELSGNQTNNSSDQSTPHH